MISSRLHGSSCINRRHRNAVVLSLLSRHRVRHKKQKRRAIFMMTRDHVLYDEISYLIPILNTIEEEAEYAESGIKTISNSIYYTDNNIQLSQTSVGSY